MSDYLTDEEQLDKLRNWWEQNGLAVVAAVVVSVIGVIGWNWYGDHREDQVSRASDLYADYLAAGEGTERQTIEQTLNEEFPESTYRVFVLMRDAQGRMAEEDAEGALALLDTALKAAPDDKLADLVRIRQARVLQQLDRSDEALAMLGSVRNGGYRAHVQELKGDIHMARGERREANEAYRAALSEAGEGSQTSLLEMKVADTADANDS